MRFATDCTFVFKIQFFFEKINYKKGKKTIKVYSKYLIDLTMKKMNEKDAWV